MSNIAESATDRAIQKRNKEYAIAGMIMISSFLALYNMAAINVAIPTFLEYFHASVSAVQWIGIGYTLVMGVVSPLAAYFTRMFTLKRYFIVSMLGFVLFSLLSGFARTIYILIIVRAVQGFAGVALIPSTMIAIYQYIPRHRQALFLTIQNMCLSLGPAIGPVIAGLLLTMGSWQMIFWLNVPLGLMGAYFAWIGFPDDEKQRHLKVDIPSFVFVALGCFPILMSFTMSVRWGLLSWRIITMLIFGVIFFTAFVRRQLSMTQPVLDFSVLSNRDYTIALIGNALCSMGLAIGPFVFSIFFQMVQGYSPLQYGLILLIPAIFSIGGAPVTQVLYHHWTSRTIIALGWISMVIGSVVLGFINAETGLLISITFMSLRYLGIGMLGMPLTDHGMRELPREQSDYGSALLNWIKLMATSFTLSFFTLIYESVVQYYEPITNATEAMVRGVDVLFLVTAFCFLVALIVCLKLKKVPPR